MRSYVRRTLVVVIAITLGLVLSTSVSMVGAQGGVQDSLDKAIRVAGWIAQNADRLGQGADVEAAEQVEVSLQLPVDDFDVTAATVAYDIPNVPCFGCVSGVPSGAIGLAFPRARVSPGQSVEYTVMRKVGTAHTGNCTAVFVAMRTSDATILDSDVYQATCSANTIGFISWGGRTVPNLPGDAIVVGMIVAQDSTRDINYSMIKVY